MFHLGQERSTPRKGVIRFSRKVEAKLEVSNDLTAGHQLRVQGTALAKVSTVHETVALVAANEPVACLCTAPVTLDLEVDYL